jgi:hypothetical protein
VLFFQQIVIFIYTIVLLLIAYVEVCYMLTDGNEKKMYPHMAFDIGDTLADESKFITMDKLQQKEVRNQVK